MYCDIVVLIFLINVIGRSFSHISADSNSLSELYDIEGKIYPPEAQVLSNWQVVTKVLVNGGEFIGFLKEDGTFTIHNVPSGSYVLEVVNPDYAYEPVRVEINSKGKYRARKVNYIQTSQVIPVTYPLKLKALSRLRYFQAREQWRITDFLFSPMVLMMVLPLLLIMVLPKMMNDPETRKEMEQINNLTKYDMPEMSEVLTSFFAGGEKQKSRAVKPSKKRQ
ncbi:ER membrane protein complex subunit 7 homolog isoform X1 [Schistocerca americana]|uniref:ER membrane protein complex subunit 7 homolog n=1 Tax=Schistocerca cancellata TaxID=274614 RepID=UPI001F4F2B74|nr:ER membrane protein complex subunit 7 homolog isoform X1 [Schistocerca americana]XP_047104338.1 ER membrane protein complex subunit 7 homolog isoform X1 [Schistocerca piceifrons]XP_049783004.1 ER membrane protein complex subunit 7 homolog [Schistocerca cancellata]XP_049806238.1 ER membrane protein complex subunit 7 homolog isoform X1 [Schistocerca nitens]XP_049806239.1 ER membrane protein complex subunit 7 homolog isoform X2 [Schistocerca nitens]XP_049844345.1 ER membrane protein complex su